MVMKVASPEHIGHSAPSPLWLTPRPPLCLSSMYYECWVKNFWSARGHRGCRDRRHSEEPIVCGAWPTYHNSPSIYLGIGVKNLCSISMCGFELTPNYPRSGVPRWGPRPQTAPRQVPGGPPDHHGEGCFTHCFSDHLSDLSRNPHGSVEHPPAWAIRC